MPNDLTKYKINEVDGFDSDTEGAGGGAIVGTILRFNKKYEWVAGDKVLPADLELVVVDKHTVLTYWGLNNKPVREKCHVYAAGEVIPGDEAVEEMNEAVPESEWRTRFGKKCGPYQVQRVLYFVDMLTMAQYTYPTATAGGAKAIKEITAQIKLKRRFHPNACPVVKLSDTYFPTDFGDRQRPHFIVVRWIDLTTGETLPDAPQLQSPVKSIPVPSNKKPAPKRAAAPNNDMDDEIPF